MNDLLLRAARGERVSRTPIWIMRQAGRYLPGFRALRSRHDFLTLCREPKLAAAVTLEPVERFDLDAAIIFADILLPLEAMGLKLDFVDGRGPALAPPVADADGLRYLHPVVVEKSLGYVLEAVSLVAARLRGRLPLIGFAGAPFTLAAYAVTGGGSRDFLPAKRLMWAQPRVWEELLSLISDVTIDYLRAQVAAGAQALQLFDSWAGLLSPEDYRRFAQPWSRRVLAALGDLDVPVIHFANQCGTFLEEVAAAGGDVVGFDWRLEMGEARRRLGPDVSLQGNLDPALLLAPQEVLAERVRQVVAGAAGGGHIFNLGHGILPETSPEAVQRLVDAVHHTPVPSAPTLVPPTSISSSSDKGAHTDESAG